jgi:hypothetical protein
MPEMLSHFSGRFADASVILPSGPLNCGQLLDFAQDVTANTITNAGRANDLSPDLSFIQCDLRFIKVDLSVVNILFFFDFYTSFANNGYFQPVI